MLEIIVVSLKIQTILSQSTYENNVATNKYSGTTLVVHNSTQEAILYVNISVRSTDNMVTMLNTVLSFNNELQPCEFQF